MPCTGTALQVTVVFADGRNLCFVPTFPNHPADLYVEFVDGVAAGIYSGYIISGRGCNVRTDSRRTSSSARPMALSARCRPIPCNARAETQRGRHNPLVLEGRDETRGTTGRLVLQP